MQVSVEESGKIQRKVMVSIPSQKIDLEVVNRLRDVARKAKIPGFRPGKIPQKIIQKRYEAQVIEEVLTETINSSYQDALEQANILPAGLLSINAVQYEAGEDLEFVITVELFPEIQHLSLEGKTIEQPVVEVTDEELENRLNELRDLHPKYVETENKAEIGDRVTFSVDRVRRGGNEIMQDRPGVDVMHVLGSDEPLSDFTYGLQGTVKGERKCISFTFPESWEMDNTGDTKIEYDLTVKKVEKRETVELDDDFALSMGVSEGGIKRFRELLRNEMNQVVDNKIHRVMFYTILDELLARNEIELPTVLVREAVYRGVEHFTEMVGEEIQKLGDEALRLEDEIMGLEDEIIRLEDEELDDEVLMLEDEELDDEELMLEDGIIEDEMLEDGTPSSIQFINEYAKRTVAQGLVVRAIVNKYPIEIDRERVEVRARELCASHENPGEVAAGRYLDDPEQWKKLQNRVREEELVSRLLETANVHPRKMTYEEFMNPKKEEQTA